MICPKNVHVLIGNHSSAESLKSLSIALLLLIVSSRVLTNCFPLFIGKASATKVSPPTTTWACLTPLSTVGVSEKTVSAATGSCLWDVECWIPRLEVFSHRESIGNGGSPLGTLFHGFLDSINIDQTKIRPEVFIVRGVIVDNMLVGPNNMLIGPDG